MTTVAEEDQDTALHLQNNYRAEPLEIKIV
jgi:hypothetical protein